MTSADSTVDDHTTPTPWEGVRFQPSVALGLLVYAGYLAIFYDDPGRWISRPGVQPLGARSDVTYSLTRI